MNTYKSVKWGCAVLSLACGLSSCMMYDDNSARSDHPSDKPIAYDQASTHHAKASAGGVTSSSSSSETAQKSTPGPKRAAAPQLPVIQ